ncbi:MAG: hypothetical protein DSO02_03585 [Hadesarchaea archaeon]|nr:MAG: hypothetical protein DSO03_03350 [Hadesarchaea archaeon]TDA33782.1 MAG: hypothetical protein DSO02_03585 [Hadesarchaea archaeon]
MARRKERDWRPILGAAVVFSLIGLAFFSAYLFLWARPAEEDLREAKTSALQQVSSGLAKVPTDQARSLAQQFSAGIKRAKSVGEVGSILVEVNAALVRERTRENLLRLVQLASNGTYHSASNVPLLSSLASELRKEVNSKNTLSELQAMQEEIGRRATDVWREFLLGLISSIENERVIMRHNSPTSWIYLTKENARELVLSRDWTFLRELHFEGTEELEVPVLSPLKVSPSVLPGSRVNLYVYDLQRDNMFLLVGNATVTKVMSSEADLRTINWSRTVGTTSSSYSMDIWETLKAAAGGSTEAGALDLKDYLPKVLGSLQEVGAGNLNLTMVYLVRVPREAGELILRYEFYQTNLKDVIPALVLS